MKRILSLITVLVLVLGLAIPALSLAAPKTPSIKSATPGTEKVTISWNAVSGVQGYEIAWGKKGVADALDQHATTTGTSVTVKGLKANTTYAFRIRAYYKSGSSRKYTSWSAKKFVTTQSPTPSTPSITSISASGAKVTVKWNKDSRAAGYEVRWDEKGRIGWRSKADVKNAGSYTATSRIVTGATMAFQVRAYWWSGSTLKFTSWSSTKYVSVPKSTVSNTKTNNTNTSCGTWTAWTDRTTTRKKITNASTMKERVVYHWWAAKCKSCGTHNPYWGSNTKCIHCGKKLPKENVTHVNIYPTKQYQQKKLNGRSDGATIDGKNYWFCEKQYEYSYLVR